jgi:flagellar export protein FliJ
MPFQFRLAPLLRYRLGREESERLRLLELHARRKSLQEELRQTHERKLKLQRSIGRTLQGSSVRAIEIQFCLESCAALDRRQQQLQISLLQLQREIAAQMQRYREERQKREILESLRDLQRGEYRLQEQRRQQAALDELYLLQRARRAGFA